MEEPQNGSCVANPIPATEVLKEMLLYFRRTAIWGLFRCIYTYQNGEIRMFSKNIEEGQTSRPLK